MFFRLHFLIHCICFYIINFYFLSYISFYVACAFVICLIKYLLTYLLSSGSSSSSSNIIIIVVVVVVSSSSSRSSSSCCCSSTNMWNILKQYHWFSFAGQTGSTAITGGRKFSCVFAFFFVKHNYMRSIIDFHFQVKRGLPPPLPDEYSCVCLRCFSSNIIICVTKLAFN